MDPEKIKIIYSSEVDSTNSHATDLLSGGKVKPPCVIYTGFQKKGKGQGDNVWYSERNRNLLCSICVEPTSLKADQSFYLSKVAALSIHSLLNKLLSSVEIKWPNDILLQGEKIAGILIENTFQKDTVLRSVLGIGLNVNQISFPDFKPKAVSMKMETNNDFKIGGILNELLVNFSKWYSIFESGDYETIDSAYTRHLFLYQHISDFMIQGKIVKGSILKIMNDGRMLFKEENGKESVFGFKEIGFI
jgi:BirA family transcriptional regulator, biotin operon repressor / biotin---[acetyl-CoA-carboxylase] ligase